MSKWYQDGLYFQCTGCGQCCTGAPGYIWVTPEEIEKIAALMALPLDIFCRRYVKKVGPRYSLIERRNGDCIFLKDKKLCEIYSERPSQCRTFPFWHETVRSEETWKATALECEGIDHPDAILYTASKIDEILEQGNI
jgi:Fe-S-cluster containining protein